MASRVEHKGQGSMSQRGSIALYKRPSFISKIPNHSIKVEELTASQRAFSKVQSFYESTFLCNFLTLNPLYQIHDYKKCTGVSVLTYSTLFYSFP